MEVHERAKRRRPRGPGRRGPEDGCRAVPGSRLHRRCPAGPGADHCLAVGFSSGAPAPGASTGEIQLRLDKTGWSDFDEADDYSRGTNTAYADASQIAVHAGGTLSWGTAP
ncbi:hypothetical protein [Streptomyces atratus]|uniref:hypothetical protein n=1 Tax=Streptomyces atratus TaxID=1893 RepID=UPI003652038D